MIIDVSLCVSLWNGLSGRIAVYGLVVWGLAMGFIVTETLTLFCGKSLYLFDCVPAC